MPETTFFYGEDKLTAKKVLKIASGNILGELNAQVKAKIRQSHQWVLNIAERDQVVYGINTGFGPLCNTKISSENTRLLQQNILRSHAVGVGEPITPLLSKLMLILKVHALAMGNSGISIEVLERILWHLKENVIPVVPEQGSVGASGDLAPLAHLFLPLVGLGEVWHHGQRVPSKGILNDFQLDPLELGPKEGLALINGTQFITAHAVIILDRFYNCLSHADILGAMMIEALMGSRKPFHPKLHALRPFPANQYVAHRIYNLLEGSQILSSHLNCNRVQDPYSLRCIAQVHGASRAAWLHLKELLEVELNAVTDNPILIDQELTISGGNFHGQPLALPLDYVSLATSELGNIADRRIYLVLEGSVEGLPKLLMTDTGINSGFMLCQYTSAALVSENKSMVYPASADSIPTSLGQEDHVSMGSISSRKALKIVENLEKIQATELLCAAQAFDFRRPLKSGVALEACHNYIRERIDHAEEDRVFAEDIETSLSIIQEKMLDQLVSEQAKAWPQTDSSFLEFEQY